MIQKLSVNNARAASGAQRKEQLQEFIVRFRSLKPESKVLRACGKFGMTAELASSFTADIAAVVEQYYAAVTHAPKLRAMHDHLALLIHKRAKKAIRLLDRRGGRPSEFRTVIDALMRDLITMDRLKCASAHRYVSPLMRFGITDETVRWATHRRPRACQEPRCRNRRAQMPCRCRYWPSGSPQNVNPFEVFEYTRPARPHDLDPRRYSVAAEVDLLRLYVARFDPRNWLSKPRKGPPELVADQDLIDDLCRSFEETTGKSACHDSTGWRSLLSAILETYGIDYLDTDNRVKRYESYKSQQRSTYGRMLLPRRVGDPTEMAQPVREKIVTSQLSYRLLESELFMGEQPAAN